MAKKLKQPAAPAPAPFVFSPAEWVPLREAYDRVRVAVGGQGIAERDLREHLRTPGTLPSIVRRFAPDGTETCELLDPEYWNDRTPEGGGNSAFQVRMIRPVSNVVVSVRGYFFVRRQELDKLYPVPGSSMSSRDDDEPLPSRAPRGPKPEHDWRREVGREIARIALAGEREPSAPEMLEWCIERWDGWEPDESHMRKLLKQFRVLF
jgi:hypothetical protein